MKNFNLTTRKALRLAASASIALMAMVATASAQNIVQISETVTLRSGNDAYGLPLNPGDDDAGVTHTLTTNPASAVSGDPAKVIAFHGAWTEFISDPDARWIHSDHDSGGTNGTGTDEDDVLYAQRFDLPALMPGYATVTVQMNYAADDRLQSFAFGDDLGSLGISTACTSFSSYAFERTVTVSDTAANLGLEAGENYLFVQQLDTGGSYSGVIYSMDVTVEFCVLEVDLRSGDGFTTGSDDTNVRALVLSDSYGASELSSALSTLGGNGGFSPKVLDAVGGWTMLSDVDAQWINSHINSSGYGNPDKCVLYAHDFQLPSSVVPGASATLDIEWAADDKLMDVYVNQVPLGITSSSTVYYDVAHSDSISGQTVSSLGLSAGPNMLFFEQKDISNNYSGVIYSAKLRIVVPCQDVAFDTFCECVSDWVLPCNNPGQPGQGCANSTGVGSSLTASGLGSNITLHADNLPLPQTIGLFFSGSNSIGPLPFGDGLRCVGPAIRLGVVITNTGQADYGPVASGTNYQFWYRDNTGPCLTGFNLTNGIEIQ